MFAAIVSNSHGDSNVTGGAAAMQRNATVAIANVSRVTATVHMNPEQSVLIGFTKNMALLKSILIP
jgi:hypothetical protein